MPVDPTRQIDDIGCADAFAQVAQLDHEDDLVHPALPQRCD